MIDIIEIWQEMSLKMDEDDSVIFKNIKVNNIFIQRLSEYNEKYMETQMFYLNNTIKLSETKIDKDKYYEIIQKQVNNAIEWCEKYKVEINKNSIYYKKNII